MKSYVGITELTNAYAEKFGTTKKEAEQNIKNVLEVIQDALLREDKDGVQFINVFTIERVERKAKIGRNPRNPEETIEIPARTSLKIKVGKILKEKLNG